MLYLKLMSPQDLPDSHSSHDFELIQIAPSDDLQFVADVERDVVSAVIHKADGSRRQIDLSGTAYVLNEQGKTIASRASY